MPARMEARARPFTEPVSNATGTGTNRCNVR